MGRQTIIRAPRDIDNPYFMLHRQTAQDASLSFEARGVLTYLLSKPGDWQLTIPDLCREGGCGRERIMRILRELEDAGYLRRDQPRDEKARFSAAIYTVFERPNTTQPTENPDTEKPDAENPDYTYNRTIQNTDQNDLYPGGKPPDKPKAKSKSKRIPATIMNPLKDALALAFGWSWKDMTKTEIGTIQKAARELAEVNAQPADIPHLYALCKARYTQFGPRALVKVWSDYRKTHRSNGPVPPSRPDGSYSPEDLDRLRDIQASEPVPGPEPPLLGADGRPIQW